MNKATIIRNNSFFIMAIGLICSALFYFQTTDTALKYYLPRSCGSSSLAKARLSCGEFQTQSQYAKSALQFSIPVTLLSASVFLSSLIVLKSKRQ